MKSSTTVPVFFPSGSTGISAETMGNALLVQSPFLSFDRRLIPFISSVEEARKVVAILDAAMDGPVTPLAFTTAAVDEIQTEMHRSHCPLIGFFDLHMTQVESILQARGERVASQLHGVGDIKRYNAPMAAIGYGIEHDDGQSLRALDKADVILVAPSRCGNTPTTMYLALQHGIFVANYPLVDEELESNHLPRPVEALRDRCYGIVTTPARLRQVRQECRPKLHIRVPRTLQLGAAPSGVAVRLPQPAHHQLLPQVGGGDCPQPACRAWPPTGPDPLEEIRDSE